MRNVDQVPCLIEISLHPPPWKEDEKPRILNCHGKLLSVNGAGELDRLTETYSIDKTPPFRFGSKNENVYVPADLKGKVFFTRLQVSDGLAEYEAVVHKGGAVAIIGTAKHPSGVGLKLPFIQIDDVSGLAIRTAYKSSVKFQLPHGVRTDGFTLPDIEAGDGKAEESSNVTFWGDNDDAMAFGNNALLDSNQRVQKPKPGLGEQFWNGAKALGGRVVDAFSGGNKRTRDITNMLEPSPDSPTEERIALFLKAYEGINTAIKESEATVVAASCAFLAKQLRESKSDLLYLAFAANVRTLVRRNRARHDSDLLTLTNAAIDFLDEKRLSRNDCEELKQTSALLPDRQAPSNVLYGLVMNLSRSVSVWSSSGRLNMFTVWVNCRPSREGYEDFIRFLNGIMTDEFAMTNIDTLLQHSERKFCMECCACLQTSPQNMHKIISHCVPPEEVVRVPRTVQLRLLEIMRALDGNPVEATKEHCSQCLILLGKIKFSKESSTTEVLEAICDLASFHDRRTFQLYSELLSLVSVEHRLHKPFTACLVRRLHLDVESLDTTTGSVAALMNFFESDGASLLIDRHCIRVLEEYWRKLRYGSASTKTKVEFLRAMFKMLVDHSDGNVRTSYFKQFLEKLSPMSLSRADLLESVMIMSTLSPNCFCFFPEDNEITFSRIAEVVVVKESATRLLGSRELLRNIFTGVRAVQAPSLLASIISRLVDVLGNSWETLVMASQANLFVCDNDNEMKALQDDVLIPLLKASLQQWNPLRIDDMLSRPEAQLRNVLDSISRTACLADHVQSLKHAISAFEETYAKKSFTLERYNRLHSKAGTASWKMIGDFVGHPLPTEKSINANIQEYLRAREKIMELNTVNNTTLDVLLNRYKCIPAKGSTLSVLLNVHQILKSDEQALVPTLADMENVVEFGIQFRSENRDCLELLDYFWQFPSLCFTEALRQLRHSEDLRFTTLRRATIKAVESVTSLFGPQSNFLGADRTVKLLTRGGTTLEHEVSVLAKSGSVEVTESDKDAFILLGVLAQARRPLERGLLCLKQLQFTACDSDTNYQSSLNLWRETFVDKDWQTLKVDDCVVFVAQFLRLIGMAETGKERCFKFLAAALREILPTFLLLERISRHVDVWRFVCDMQWLGADGLARFFEEFNNVTNTLMGSSESYEMSVLDIVMSTIPVLSAVGGTRSERGVGSLLNHLRGHKDLTCESLLQFDQNIVQVQRELSQIREWFTTGVDELSNVLSILKHAFQNGTFELKSSADKLPSLSLVYEVEGDVSSEMSRQRRLDQDELRAFSTQLELVESEGDVSVDIGTFLEQHHVGVVCVRLASELTRFGYRKSTGTSMSFRVGSQGSEVVRALHETLMQSRKDCAVWLEGVKQRYPFILLFWMEELQIMYLLLVSCAETPSENVKFRAASLLLKTVQVDGREKVGTVEETARSMDELLESCWKEIREEESSWLEATARFVEMFQKTLSFERDTSIVCDKKSTLVLHTLAVDDADEATAVHAVIHNIYKVGCVVSIVLNGDGFS